MRRIIILFCAVILCTDVLSQQQTQFKRYYVQFTDKNHSPYSFSDSLAYLSQRAINRRINQYIPIDSLDLPVNPDYTKSVTLTGAGIMYPTKWLNGVIVATTDTNVVKSIERLPFVKNVIAISVINTSGTSAPRSAKKKTPSNIDTRSAPNNVYNYGSSINQIEMINGTGLHNDGYQGQGMVIASLDDGYTDANVVDCFDSLFAEGRVLGWHDFVSLDNSDIFNLSTYGDHGTETLSTTAGYLPGQLIGTAPEASYWLIRTENDSSENPVEMYNWVAGAEFADSVGADIITSSLGYSTFDSAIFNYTYTDMNGKTAPCSIAATIAATKGIIVCSSAGNEGATSWRYITAPADADSIITVGNVNPNGVLDPNSGQGPTSDGRLKPNIVAQGDPATIIIPETGITTTGFGTSFSCPIIAGMTACLWQKFHNKTNQQIISAIQQSASLYEDPNYLYGYDIPDYGLASLILNLTSSIPPPSPSTVPYVFPNPFSEQLNVIFYTDTSSNENLQVYDMIGRLVYNTNISTTNGVNHYDLAGLNQLSQGMYILVIGTAGNQVMVKIVKL